MTAVFISTSVSLSPRDGTGNAYSQSEAPGLATALSLAFSADSVVLARILSYLD